jgi:hypothetical protein
MTSQNPSLGRRLMVAAGVFIAAALIVAAVMIAFVLHRFVQGQIDQRLDAQIVFLSSMLAVDRAGKVTLAGDADGPAGTGPFPGRTTCCGPDHSMEPTSTRRISAAGLCRLRLRLHRTAKTRHRAIARFRRTAWVLSTKGSTTVSRTSPCGVSPSGSWLPRREPPSLDRSRKRC